MFVAIRDLRFAKGRFALMGAVVTLITLLVVLLSGLTAGLGRGNTSAITDLPADHLVFSAARRRAEAGLQRLIRRALRAGRLGSGARCAASRPRDGRHDPRRCR